MPSSEGMLKVERAALAAVTLLMPSATIASVWGEFGARSESGLPGPWPGRILGGVFSAIRTRALALKKLILLSVIIASVVMPVRAARAKDGFEGLKRALIQTAIFEIIYVVLVTQVWFRMA